MGTLAILLKAKERGVIHEVRGVVNALIAADFRVSDALVQEVLRVAGE
jgi:predicted nucleic acid-binding protein